MVKQRRKTLAKAPRSIRRMFPGVDLVVDAAEPVTVTVKQTDCDKAEPLNPSECAMAKAFKREFKADAAVIGLSSSYLITGNKAIRFSTPETVQREIVSFDRHADFSPGQYDLVPKAPTQRLGYQRDQRRSHGTNKNARRTYHKTPKVRIFGGQ